MKETSREIGVALLGLGTVGSATYRMLQERSDEFTRRFDLRFSVKKVLVHDLNKKRDLRVPSGILTDDMDLVLADPDVKVVIELIGGVDPAFDYVSRSLRSGRAVVTANKWLLAEKGKDLESIALEQGVLFRYDASVGGIIPIYSTMGGGKHAMDVQCVSGILNGTTNYILSSMYKDHTSYEDALQAAQEEGLTEPDPTMDVSGLDIAHKLCVLSRLIYGTFLPLENVKLRGIGPECEALVKGARHRGKKLKLVGELTLDDVEEGGLPIAKVDLDEIDTKDQLYSFDGTTNCIIIRTYDTGEILICGRGAGGKETATAVVSDLLIVSGWSNPGLRG